MIYHLSQFDLSDARGESRWSMTVNMGERATDNTGEPRKR